MTLRLLRFRLSVERICRFTRANYLCDLRESYRIPITQIIVTARISDTPPMTGDESRKLKIGDRVCWQGDKADQGTVIETNWSGVTVKWDNRSRQTILHNDMAQVERVPVNLR
jgi:hypothetical protein